MEIIGTTIPGVGHSYDCSTRDGQRFAVLVEHSGRRMLLVHAPGGPDDRADGGDRDNADGDRPRHIVLEPDEADQIADLLHQRSVADRLAELERRVAELVRARA